MIVAVMPMLCLASDAQYDVAAYVWPAYQPEPRWAELGIFADGKGEWQNLYEAQKRYPDDYQGVKPLWGYENEADPAVVARKIDAATAAGVNVFIYDWYWYGGRPFLEAALDEGFLKAPNCRRMKFFVMYANHDVTGLWNNKIGGKKKDDVIWPSKISDADWREIVRRWISLYFSQPNYYRIGGCPAVMLYDLDMFVRWDGLEKAKGRLAYLRNETKKAGFRGVHLMALANFRSARDLGVDSLTFYNWLYETWDRVNDPKLPQLTYREWGETALRNFDRARSFAKSFGASFFPNLTIGWDTNARYPASDVRNMVHGSNPTDFESFARRVKEWSDENGCSDGPRLITVNSWNEWTEGSNLEPDDRFGYGYLDVLRRVFGASAGGATGEVMLDAFPRFAGETDDAPRLRRAIAAVGAGELRIPSGTYDISSTVCISNRCSLRLHRNAVLRAVKPMEFVLKVNGAAPEVARNGDYSQFLTGGKIDGNGLAGCLALDQCWHFTVRDVTFLNARGCGLLVDGEKPSSEIVGDNLYFACQKSGLAGNTALRVMGCDHHFTDVVAVDYTTGVDMRRGFGNRFTRCHVWGGVLPARKKGTLPEMLENSVCFRLGAESGNNVFRDCYADTGLVGFLSEGWENRLLGCSYSWNPQYGVPDSAVVFRQPRGSLLVGDGLVQKTIPGLKVYEGCGHVSWRDMIYNGPKIDRQKDVLPGEANLYPKSSGRADPSDRVLWPGEELRLLESDAQEDRFPWPCVRLAFVAGERDLSAFDRLEVAVSNRTARPLRVSLAVRGVTFQGLAPGGAVALEPYRSGILEVPLKCTPWVLDAEVPLHGMNGAPRTTPAPIYDLSRMKELDVYADPTCGDDAFAVERVVAVSASRPRTILKADGFLPFVDRYGQFRHADWPGKTHADDELVRSREDEAKWLAAHGQSPIPDVDVYGGWSAGPKLKATGRFRTEKVDGKWWFVDPDGHLFFSLGVDDVCTYDVTCTRGRESYFEWLPKRDDPVFAGFWGEMSTPSGRGYYRDPANLPTPFFNFAEANARRKYGEDWGRLLRERAHTRLRAWGLNTIGCWSSSKLCDLRRTPYVAFFSTGGCKKKVKDSNGWWGALPDPWSNEFSACVRQEARRLAPRVKDDPWCLGVFVDNELSWNDKPGMQEIAERYYSVVSTILREELPGVLYLGSRIVWGSKTVFRAAAKYCDVVSVNMYERLPNKDLPSDAVDKPMINGEFHFGTFDRGVLHPGLLVARDQKDRGECFRDYVNACLDHPRFVGTHWFQWCDQPLAGRHDGENFSVGLVDVTDRPYPEMVKAMRTVAAGMYARRFKGGKH